MTSGPTPLCLACRWLLRASSEPITCRAYPQGIPEPIWLGGDHRQPRGDEDAGRVFSPAPDRAAMARQITARLDRA